MHKTIVFLLLLLITACGTAPQNEAIVVTPSRLQALIGSNDFYVGEPRVPVILYDGADSADAASVTVELFDLDQDPPQAIWSGEATSYAEYEVPYWVIRPNVPAAGNWGLGLQVQMNDGTTEQLPVTIAVAEEAVAPIMGELPPASNNRTIATDDIKLLTSGADPNPALYQMTVADALQSGKPTVVSLATPAFCQTKICAPVVDSVEAVYESVGDAANFIHLEIYKDFQNLTLADEVEEWGLQSEPWTFVLAADGTVAARLGGPVSTQEILDYVEPLLAQ